MQIAAAHEDPEVVAAALDVMATRFTHIVGGTEDLAGVDERYAAAVVRNLTVDTEPAVLYAATNAALNAIEGEPDPSVVAALVALGNDHPDRSVLREVLTTFAYASPAQADAGVAQLVLDAMSADEPWIVVSALDQFEISGFADPAVFVEPVRAALAHEHPVVRGRAARALGNLADEGATGAFAGHVELEPLLSDSEPMVRGSAAEGLGIAERLASIPVLLGLTTDPAPTEAELAGWTELYDGSPGSTTYGAGAGRVDTAALDAIARASSDHDFGFPFPTLDYANLDASIAENAQAAQDWYAANETAIAAAAAEQTGSD